MQWNVIVQEGVIKDVIEIQYKLDSLYIHVVQELNTKLYNNGVQRNRLNLAKTNYKSYKI